MKILKLIAILFFDLIDKYYHQRRIINFIKNQNFNIKVFLDIGSHKGTYTDLILNNFKNCKSYLFEPQKHIFKFLKKKYKKKKNIHIFNYALSNKKSIQTLNINQHDLTSSLSKIDVKNSYLKLKAKLFSTTSKKMIFKKEKVRTQKLVDLLKSKKINNIDLLKIDTEGHELQVLKGLNNEIKNFFWCSLDQISNPNLQRIHMTESGPMPAISVVDSEYPLLWGLTYRFVGHFTNLFNSPLSETP